MTKLDLSKARIAKLTKRNIKLAKNFDCGDDDLNEFLKEDSLDHAKSKIAVTYLFLYEDALLGFFCVGMHTIKPDETALEVLKERGKNYPLLPAILIGRLGVDKRYWGRGVGTGIIKVVLGLALKASRRMGCRFIVVDAYHNVVDFYKKNGFKILTKGKKTVKMYLDLLQEF